MSWLVKVAPWYWRWGALAALAVALAGWGYVHGYLHEEHKFDVYQAEVDAIGKEAAKRAAERKAAQDRTTKEVRDEHAAEVDLIHDYYAANPHVRVVRVPTPDRSAVPAAADRPARTDGTACESRPAEPDRALEERCALDAATVNAWRAFARKNGLPVE